MADITILQNARAVDEITHEEFQKRSRTFALPQPESVKYDATNAHMFYGLSSVDGRVVAVRFLDHLAKDMQGYHVERPRELDDPELNLVRFSQIPDATLNRLDIEASSTRTAGLINYSKGNLIIFRPNHSQFYIRGAAPNSNSFSISAGLFDKDRTAFYQSFIETLK